MVDYWETDIVNNPQCPHGPSLLLSRKTNNRKFYACAAFRDRKKCPFFRWENESSNNSVDCDSFRINFVKFIKHREKLKKLQETRLKCGFCYTCEMVILNEDFSEHEIHELVTGIDSEYMRCPTKFLCPKQDNKGESQFHFTENTIAMIYEFFIQLKITGVLCIGCPQVHEYITNKVNCPIKSLLLDIDYRFLQFYESNQFQVFNLFNCYMFDIDGWNFVKEMGSKYKNILLIIDPPFGGRIEPLAFTFKQFTSLLSNCNVTILLVLPYFMEPAVKHSLPNFSMLDYKVEYTNHKTIKKQINSNRGSMVRIFTNASPSLFVLPKSEGYKFCESCDRWVYRENKHCYKCKTCTSKNGGYYHHCNQCKKCVKQTWKHCHTCKICKLVQHNCNNSAVSS